MVEKTKLRDEVNDLVKTAEDLEKAGKVDDAVDSYIKARQLLDYKLYEIHPPEPVDKPQDPDKANIDAMPSGLKRITIGYEKREGRPIPEGFIDTPDFAIPGSINISSVWECRIGEYIRHQMVSMAAALETIYQYMANNGMLIIDEVKYCANAAAYEGELAKPISEFTFLPFSKEWHERNRPKVAYPFRCNFKQMFVQYRYFPHVIHLSKEAQEFHRARLWNSVDTITIFLKAVKE